MRHEIEVRKLLNFPVDSNCFIVSKNRESNCIIIDPAQGEGEALCEYLYVEGLIPNFIILTHEHFDHISSVEHLREKFRCKVVSSIKCSSNITNSKKNLSQFYDQKGFACLPSDVLVDRDGYILEWNNKTINFYLTPGHSEGGMCFNIENNLFTGDTLMEEYKTTVKLPGGNKTKLTESIHNLLKSFDLNTKIFPGHGEIFRLEKLASKISL
jgi:hydroxyacylglutathione hydrolase